MRKAIPIEKRYGVALWRLPTGNSFRSVAKTSQIETATAMELFQRDCNCKISKYGTHIFIQTPENERKFDYYCRKQRYSINTQDAFGSNLIFLNVSTVFPGSMHYSRVLKNSSLFHEAGEEVILSNPTDVIEKTKVGPVLVGDGRYPLNKWLIKPYTFSPALSQKKRNLIKPYLQLELMSIDPLEFAGQDEDVYLNNFTTVLKTFPMLLLCVLHCINFVN